MLGRAPRARRGLDLPVFSRDSGKQGKLQGSRDGRPSPVSGRAGPGGRAGQGRGDPGIEGSTAVPSCGRGRGDPGIQGSGDRTATCRSSWDGQGRGDPGIEGFRRDFWPATGQGRAGIQGFRDFDMTSGRRPETRNSGIQGFRDHTFDRGSEAPAIDATRRRLSTRGRASLDPPPTAHRRRRRLRRRRRRGGRRRRDGIPSPAMAQPSRLAPSPWKAQTTLPLYPNPSPDPNRRAGARVFASRLSDGDEDQPRRGRWTRAPGVVDVL